jgi:uncharacterized RDD family membrane protein YckC
MLVVMNATAQASAASITGSKLDNRRVLAALVDLGIVAVGALVILVAADALGDPAPIRGGLGAVMLGWALYYHFALESGDGQTVGKKLMKLRVVLANGSPAGMREIAVRTVLRVVDGFGVYVVGLIVMMVSGERRQRLGDLAAGTIVVDASATSVAPPPPPAFEAQVEDEPVEDADFEDDPVETESAITLPTRSAPATLADLGAPVAPPVPELRPFDPPEDAEPKEDEPVEDEPFAAVTLVEPVEDEQVAPIAVVEVVEDEPVEDEPFAAVTLVEPVEHEPVAEPLSVVEDVPGADELADPSTPSLEQLARDVAAVGAEPLSVVEDEPEEEPFTLKSVETVSAIDLVMGGSPEDDSEDDPIDEGPAAS